MLVVGSSRVATSFFREQLIHELWLTLEPRIFGTGGDFVIEENLDIRLTLITSEKVNEKGTLIFLVTQALRTKAFFTSFREGAVVQADRIALNLRYFISQNEYFSRLII